MGEWEARSPYKLGTKPGAPLPLLHTQPRSKSSWLPLQRPSPPPLPGQATIIFCLGSCGGLLMGRPASMPCPHSHCPLAASTARRALHSVRHPPAWHLQGSLPWEGSKVQRDLAWRSLRTSSLTTLPFFVSSKHAKLSLVFRAMHLLLGTLSLTLHMAGSLPCLCFQLNMSVLLKAPSDMSSTTHCVTWLCSLSTYPHVELAYFWFCSFVFFCLPPTERRSHHCRGLIGWIPCRTPSLCYIVCYIVTPQISLIMPEYGNSQPRSTKSGP